MASGSVGGDRRKEPADWEWLTAREWYASELAYRRQQSGMTLVQLAELCLYEQSYLHRLERGRRLLRDRALPPAESLAFLRTLLGDHAGNGLQGVES